MKRDYKQHRTTLTLQNLEARDVPAIFNIPNPALGQVAAQNALITAINTANNNGEDDTINLYAGGDYQLTLEGGGSGSASAFPVITDDLDQQENTHQITINGRGATLARASQTQTSFRIFEIASGGLLFINNTTLANGAVPEGESGGAILVRGGLDARGCLFRDNQSDFSGGAIAFGFESAGGFLFNSTFYGNTNFGDDGSGGGGAIFIDSSSSEVVINNCTITQNGNFVSQQTLPTTDETSGGGIRGNGSMQLTNTIVFGNVANEVNDDDVADDLIFSAVNSIIGNYGTLALTTATSPNLNDDPLLRNLANNGGLSQTVALRSGSPGINTGNSNVDLGGATTDQRGTGFARRIGRIDVGAYEFKTNSRMTIRSSRNPSRVGDPVTFTAIITPTNPRFNLGDSSGDVTFVIDGVAYTPVKVVNNGRGALIATLPPISDLARGSHVVRATYTDPSQDGLLDDASASLIQVVGKQGRRWIR